MISSADFSGCRHIVADGNIGQSCHAEIKALKMWISMHCKSANLKILKKITLYSLKAKLDDNMNLILSYGKPCLRCHQSLIKWNIKKVYYSNDEGSIIQCNNDTKYRLSYGDRKHLNASTC